MLSQSTINKLDLFHCNASEKHLFLGKLISSKGQTEEDKEQQQTSYHQRELIGLSTIRLSYV